MAEATLNPLAAIVSLMLPIGLSQQADVSYELRIPNYQDKTSTVATRIVNLLKERGAIRGRQIDSHFSRVDWRRTANILVKKGVLTTKNVLPPPRVRPEAYSRCAAFR